MKKIKYAFELIHKKGIYEFLKAFYYKINNNYYEKYFNVNTIGFISKEDLGISNHESVEYSPMHYKHIFSMLKKLPVDKEKSTLLDYGCGKGRVIITAAAFPFNKIIGVEISYLIDVAKNNIDRGKHRKTNNIELINCDAMDYIIPDDVNIFYFFNPFRGAILEKVTRNIYSSFKEIPRKIFIIFFNNDHFDKVIAHQDWLTKIEQSEFYFNYSCGLYETNI